MNENAIRFLCPLKMPLSDELPPSPGTAMQLRRLSSEGMDKGLRTDAVTAAYGLTHEHRRPSLAMRQRSGAIWSNRAEAVAGSPKHYRRLCPTPRTGAFGALQNLNHIVYMSEKLALWLRIVHDACTKKDPRSPALIPTAAPWVKLYPHQS